jgi:hypothetical protein
VLVDVGLAPPPVDPEVVQAPDLLDFAGVAPVRVLVIPTAWHVAEKVHAYTRRYGADAAPSSRPKDLIDLVLLAAHEEADIHTEEPIPSIAGTHKFVDLASRISRLLIEVKWIATRGTYKSIIR